MNHEIAPNRFATTRSSEFYAELRARSLHSIDSRIESDIDLQRAGVLDQSIDKIGIELPERSSTSEHRHFGARPRGKMRELKCDVPCPNENDAIG